MFARPCSGGGPSDGRVSKFTGIGELVYGRKPLHIDSPDAGSVTPGISGAPVSQGT